MIRSNSFEERYRLSNAIGHPGSYGKVHAAVCKRSGRSLAVKIMKKPLHQSTRSDRIRALMIHSEATIMRSIRDPHIVDVVEVIETRTKLFIVMEECRGGDLFDRIMGYNGKIPEATAVGIFRQLLQAVEYIHDRRIVHGDLKLSNIMFEDDSDGSLRLIDFGLSQFRLDGSAPLTEMVGTPNYQSPDVISGSYSFEADVWSMGVILFVMVFGFNPFDPFGTTDDSVIIHRRVMAGFEPVIKSGYGAFFPADIATSPDLKDLIAKMLQPDPRRRIGLDEILVHAWMQTAKPYSTMKSPMKAAAIVDLSSAAPCA